MSHKFVRIALFTVLVSGLVIQTMNYSESGKSAAQSQQSMNQQFIQMMTLMNANLAASSANYRVEVVEYLTLADAGEVGQTVFFKDRSNNQLAARFVPGDPRRGGRTNITYLVDQTEGANDGLTVAQTTAAIDRAVTTWNNVQCSNIPITKLPDIPGADLGLAEALLLGQIGGQFALADITHAGWIRGGILPNGVIAGTFGMFFVDPATGQPTDINNDGKPDVAFREILYNDFHTWGINRDVDVESIALHEFGHGLSQSHFGMAFVTGSNGKIHFAPQAVMNAAYSGIQHNITGTDNAGHCSIWESWPNN